MKPSTFPLSNSLSLVTPFVLAGALCACSGSSSEPGEAQPSGEEAAAAMPATEVRTTPHVGRDVRPDPRVRTMRLLGKLGARHAPRPADAPRTEPGSSAQ